MTQSDSSSRSTPNPLPSQIRWLFADMLLWVAMLWVARWVRLDLKLPPPWGINAGALSVVLGILATVIIAGWAVGLYSRRRRIWPGTNTEAVALFGIHSCAALVGFLLATLLFPGASMPRSTPLIAGGFVIAVVLISRAVWRWFWPRVIESPNTRRALVYGTGVQARHFLSGLPAANQSLVTKFLVVGVIAESEATKGRRVHGMRTIAPNEHDIESAITRTGATVLLLVADETIDPERISEFKRICTNNSMELLVRKTDAEAFDADDDAPLSTQLRDINISDLIGRDPVSLDERALRHVLEDKRVLVTGAGGSIGSEICRQVAQYDPRELILLDRDEGGLHATQLSLTRKALLDGKDTVLADIRDPETITALFKERHPHIVFHAAALKHQPLLEQYPSEAIKTNVLGTQHVLDAAAAAGVEIVVNVSTDKAANPTSVLGQSKRAAERLTAYMATRYSGKWVSVRFGNVFGSRGSVIDTFRGQIEKGGPVTVTDPNVERFFMTIPEASQLVLQAAAVGRSGETLVLEMGKPVKIVDIARSMIEIYATEDRIPIEFTGLRPGEKLSEELVDYSETPIVGDRHELITEVTVQPVRLDSSVHEAARNDPVARRWLSEYGGSDHSQFGSQTKSQLDERWSVAE